MFTSICFSKQIHSLLYYLGLKLTTMKAEYYRDQLSKLAHPNENYELYYEINVFCINLKKEQESLRMRLDDFRERVLSGVEPELGFDHPDFNKILDDFNDLGAEIKILEELMLKFDHEKAGRPKQSSEREKLVSGKVKS
jgi:hypothetical protein